MDYPTIGFKLLTKTAKLPEYASTGAAGADLRADILFPMILYPGERYTISTGIMLEVPYGWEGQIRSRSGLASKYGVSVLNSPGTLDSDFRGEIKVILINSGIESKDQFIINPGDRIAQLVIAKVSKGVFKQIEEVNQTERGSNGFGSTGIS